LLALVTEVTDLPYRWGEHDCMLFVGKVIYAVTGEDVGEKHREQYSNEIGAYRYLKKLGHDGPESFLDELLEQKPVGFAQRGDIVLRDDGIPALCMGSFALMVGQQDDRDGLFKVPRSDWVKAWAVGDHHSSWPE